ncbi:myo-inositol 2-dehydrogenase [Aplysia californica]|uniref:Myo-inositol 2-dehydrogenase n=1 Tax=Aplysia californica TaxID=6500 RepID=A0ABM1ACR1_APLCA|nr:myo-inositol 2-dehydrogenase [Aplysia californica]
MTSLSHTATQSDIRALSSQHGSKKKRFNIGVLGAGRIGRMHMQNVLRNRKMSLTWVVEDSPEASSALREDFLLQDTPFYSSGDLPRLLSDDSLDAVLIFTSTPSHASLTCQALESGKAVFVEKPAGETREEIRQCFEASEKANRPFLIGFNRRFDPTMSEAHRRVSSGDVGKLQYLRFTTRDSPKPSYDFLKSCDTTGCNILADLSVHDVDQLVWLTQSERPEHIYVTTHAHDATMAEFKEADAIGVMIKYPSGIIASLDGFRESVYGYDIRMEIFGSDGVVMANNPRETSVTFDRADGGRENRLHYSFPQRFEESFRAELGHFVDCLEGKATPLIKKEESLLVAEIIDKGLESFQKKAPVYF